MIVKVKDDHLVLVQKVELVQVRFVFQELIYPILMRKERGLVRDDQVFACGGGALPCADPGTDGGAGEFRRYSQCQCRAIRLAAA